MPKTSLTLFDFDGTLTRADSFPLFIRHAAGWLRFALGFALYSPWLVAVKLRLTDGGRVKERLFRRYFRGMAAPEFYSLCRSFAASHVGLLRRNTAATLRRAVADGQQVAIVSASLSSWIAPFFADCLTAARPLRIISTEPEIVGGRLTGRFATPNCNGPEKRRRLDRAFPDRGGLRVVAYGDSRGDREMFEWADEAVLLRASRSAS